MEYRLLFDHHTHTTFSHGKGSIEDNVKVAVEKGLKSIAITDHGPGHLTYGVKRENLKVMRDEIDRLSAIYPIEIKLGVEANIVDSENGLDLREEDKEYLDFVIAGYHYGVTHGHCMWNYTYNHGIHLKKEELMKINTELTIRAVEKNDLYILTHPGDKGPFDIEAISKACQETGTLMEINNRHHHLTTPEVEIAKGYDVNFVFSSDAHKAEDVGRFEESLRRAQEGGLDLSRVVNLEEITCK